MEKKINYWIELSDYDLETAEAMLKSKRYLYVGFMCHQTIEKIFTGKKYFDNRIKKSIIKRAELSKAKYVQKKFKSDND
jgi:uncharacterized protein YeeX (DUF496 family)